MKYTDAWSRALPPVQAKQCMTLKPSTGPAYEKATELIFLFAKKEKKKRQNGQHFVMETSAEQSWVSHHEADIFVQA